MTNKLKLSIFFTSVLFALTACGGGGSSSGTGGGGNPSTDNPNSSTGLPSDINGLIVLDTWYNIGGPNYYGIYAFELNNGQVKSRRLTTAAKGIHPYAHDRNTITYAEPCSGPYTHHRIKIINVKGLSSAQIIPCSSEIMSGIGQYLVAKISPDKSKIAIEILAGTSDSYNNLYNVKIFDRNTGVELYSYTNFQDPEWLPSGRLLLAGSDENDKKGIFITDKDFTKQPVRIDSGKINQSVSFLNLSPSANKLIFSMSGRIWMMDIDRNYTLGNLQEIISEGATLSVPVWSPDGKYIAYRNQSYNLTFWHVDSKIPYVFDTKRVLPKHVSPGYFSWVK